MIQIHWLWMVVIAIASGSVTFLFALLILSARADRLGEDE